MICGKCGRNTDDNGLCRFCTDEASGSRPEHKIPIYGVSGFHQMKWYKFLIYFSLFFSAVSCGVDAIAYLTGRYWDYYALLDSEFADIYDRYESARYIDIAMGIVMIMIAGYCICVRNSLARFKKSGPVMLYVLYALNQVVQIVYNVALGAAGVIDVNYSQLAGGILGCALLIWLNIIYFKKRADLFVV